MQTLIRGLVMLASLGAGVWAFVEYGPIERVQPWTAKAIEWADQRLGRSFEQPAEASVSVPWTNHASTTQLIAPPDPAHLSEVSAPPLVSPGVVREQAGIALAPARAASDMDISPELAAVLAQLDALGMQNVALTPWGRSVRFFRATGELPVAHSNITRHLDAVARDPATAAADILRQARAWQSQGGQLIARQ